MRAEEMKSRATKKSALKDRWSPGAVVPSRVAPSVAPSMAALVAPLMAALVTMLAAVYPALATAQAWPAKPLRFVVNFPPGGAADTIARAVAVPLGEKLGQSVIVENRAGANGNIGGEVVAKAGADGYTFLMSSAGVSSINPQLYPKMPFDPTKDLVPVAAAARVLVFLVTRATLPVADFPAFIAYLKANPGKVSFGTPGNGSSPHLAAEMLKGMTGTARSPRALPRCRARVDTTCSPTRSTSCSTPARAWPRCAPASSSCSPSAA